MFLGYFRMPACEYSKFEAHMQEKMQFTAYLRGFVNKQHPRHLKAGIIFPSKCFLFLSPLKMENSKEPGPKVPAKKVT